MSWCVHGCGSTTLSFPLCDFFPLTVVRSAEPVHPLNPNSFFSPTPLPLRFRQLPAALPQRRQDPGDRGGARGTGQREPEGFHQTLPTQEPQSQQPQLSHQPLHAFLHTSPRPAAWCVACMYIVYNIWFWPFQRPLITLFFVFISHLIFGCFIILYIMLIVTAVSF